MHMTCLIAGKNYEEQLAPFQENNMGDCPEEFLDVYSYTVYSYVNGEKCFECLDFNNEEEAKEYCKNKGIEFNTGDGYWTNSRAKWDWYQVGGRWYGYFVKKSDGYGEKGDKSWMDLRPDIDDNSVDIVRKGDIDIDEIIKRSGDDNKEFLDIIRPYAFIKNGEFIEKYNNESYKKEFQEWWDSLSDDEIIVAIDYHMQGGYYVCRYYNVPES